MHSGSKNGIHPLSDFGSKANITTYSVWPGSSPLDNEASSYLISLINDELLNYIVRAIRGESDVLVESLMPAISPSPNGLERKQCHLGNTPKAAISSS